MLLLPAGGEKVTTKVNDTRSMS